MTGGGSGRSAGAAVTLGASALGASGHPGRVGNTGHFRGARRTLAVDAQALDCSPRQVVGVAALIGRHCSLDRGYGIRRSRDRCGG